MVVLSGAQKMADSFHEDSLIGLINWADVALGIAAKGVYPSPSLLFRAILHCVGVDVALPGYFLCCVLADAPLMRSVEHVLLRALELQFSHRHHQRAAAGGPGGRGGV